MSLRFLMFFLILSVVFTSSNTIAQEKSKPGTIKGIVLDKDSQSPLIGTNVIIVGTTKGAATDMNGQFIITNVPAGSYTLQFDYIGYEQLKLTDIIVRPERTTFVQAEMNLSMLEGEEISVTAGYFPAADKQPTSSINFSYEEIRRAPGAAGDVNRIISSLPSIAKTNDQYNSLVVRGGSPIENVFYVDNIEIPNINHFPTQGSTGGAISVLNVDFIKDVNFYTGGFQSRYGDRLSSVMDLSLREGNRDEFDGQLDLNFAGIGGIAEGPAFGKKGSYMVSARRSYVDWLVKLMDIGVAPKYGDASTKIVYDINSTHQIALIDVMGIDYNSPTKKDAEDLDFSVYGSERYIQNTVGVNWRWLWNKNGYTLTSISHAAIQFRQHWTQASSDELFVDNRSLEQTYNVRQTNFYRFNEYNAVDFGFEIKHLAYDYNNFYGEYTDPSGNPTPALMLDDQIGASKFAAFLNYQFRPFSKLQTQTGVRVDYFSYNKNYSISPRFSFSYRLTEKTTLNGSTGLFYQNLPLIILSQEKENRDLKNPKAVHFNLGLSHLLTDDTRLTVELYRKNYSHLPLDPAQPKLNILDELFYRNLFYLSHGPLTDKGKAYSQGIEVILQKKLATNFYGLISGSYFRTRYRDSGHTWRDRVFDNRWIVGIEGGYKPNNRWEFSARWVYAGGAPYTPFDVVASTAINRAVFDDNRINEKRYPSYHSLNVRFDKRFLYESSNLVFYVSIWNAYNRKNVASYYWNEFKNKPDTSYQFSLLPIFGLEYEF